MRHEGTEKESPIYQPIKLSLRVESPSLRVSSPRGELMADLWEIVYFV